MRFKKSKFVVIELFYNTYTQKSYHTNTVQKVKEIKSIWLKLMIRNEEQSYLLVVDFAGDRKKIFSGLADAARDYLPSRMYIDIVPYNDDFGRKAAENSKPFYQRKHKLFGLFG